MKIHRFIVASDISAAQPDVSDPELVHQIRDVLHLSVGETIALADGKGNEAECIIVALDERRISVSVVRRRQETPSSEVTLIFAVLKRENAELVVQKATEIGVTKIVPMITARTVKQGLKMERLVKIAKEASEQCGRATIPEITEIVSFGDVASLCGPSTFFCDASAQEFFGDAMKRYPQPRRCSICIGPEGGWSPEEIAMAEEKACAIVHLGATMLRGETAAIVASFLACRG